MCGVMSMKYKITPLCLGHIQRPKTNMIYQCGDSAIQDFPLIAFYLENDEHKIMVDTGGTAPDGKKWMPYQRSDNESMEAQLAAIRVDPKEIDTVILTHLHWDHAGNNTLFPNAIFYAQRFECENLEQPGVDVFEVSKTVYMPVDGNTILFPGIRLVLTPGHSRGSQCVIVDTIDGEVGITGDLIPTYENWEADPKIPNGGNYDIEIITKSIEKIGHLCKKILPGHDNKVLR